MADKASQDSYHHWVTPRWIDTVAAETVREMMMDAQCEAQRRGGLARLTAKDVATLEQNMHFLGRAARGFVVEFMRQTAERTPDLNYDDRMPEQEIARRAEPGLLHATACVNGLMRRGLDVNAACCVLGMVIRHTIDTYTNHYNDTPSLEGKGDPMASVLMRADRIRAHLESVASSRNSGKTLSP